MEWEALVRQTNRQKDRQTKRQTERPTSWKTIEYLEEVTGVFVHFFNWFIVILATSLLLQAFNTNISMR